MEMIDLKTIYTIFHVFGAVLGAGGAYVSDAMFFSAVRDEVITKTELRFLRLGSTFVWLGLIILVISGALLFSTNPEAYMASSKFQIKMLIVAIIFVNGVIFHWGHMPHLHRHVDVHYPSSDEFVRRKKFLVASGVISFTSWTFAVILGMLRMIPFTFVDALLLYLVVEVVTIGFAMLFAKRLF